MGDQQDPKDQKDEAQDRRIDPGAADAVEGRSRMDQLEKRVETVQEKQGGCRWDEIFKGKPYGQGGQQVKPEPALKVPEGNGAAFDDRFPEDDRTPC